MSLHEEYLRKDTSSTENVSAQKKILKNLPGKLIEELFFLLRLSRLIFPSVKNLSLLKICLVKTVY